MNILLVYPRSPDTFWSFKHVLKFVSKKAAFPPLGLLTVAAMLPRDWNLKLVDLNVAPLTDAALGWADYVFLSGMIVHKDSAHEVAARCAALGKTVIAGGPLFTTGHQDFPEIRHFVLGEAEDLIGELVRGHGARRAAACVPLDRLARRTPDARAALGPHRSARLRHHAGAVLARLPVQLRVLRHRGHERARAAHQGARAGGARAGSPAPCRLEGHGLHRRRQLHRQPQAHAGIAPRADRVARAREAEDGFPHRSVGESRRSTRSCAN